MVLSYCEVFLGNTLSKKSLVKKLLTSQKSDYHTRALFFNIIFMINILSWFRLPDGMEPNIPEGPELETHLRQLEVKRLAGLTVGEEPKNLREGPGLEALMAKRMRAWETDQARKRVAPKKKAA
jgi:hypothetical protein